MRCSVSGLPTRIVESMRTPDALPPPPGPCLQVTMEGMEQILAGYRGRYTTICGFQPTGWTHQRDTKGLRAGRRLQRGTVVLYKV